MNKSNLQVFLETSEKIAAEKKQRLDEISFKVRRDPETGEFDAEVKAITPWSALLAMSYGAFTAIQNIAAFEAGTAAGFWFIAASGLPTVIATLAGVAGVAFLYKKFKNFFKKNKNYDPEAQLEKFISSLREKVLNNPDIDVTEEQLNGYLELLSTSVKQDEEYRRLSKEMLKLLSSKENNESEVVDLTGKLDDAFQDVLARLQKQTEDNLIILPAPEQEPEEELAMVAEAKQYDRWKVIAGVKK